MKAQSVKEVLIAARWIIKHVGWCQENYGIHADGSESDNTDVVDIRRSPCVAYCLAGALEAVETDEDLRWQTEALLNNQSGEGYIFFNDTPGRTKEEVLSLLDDAIEEAP